MSNNEIIRQIVSEVISKDLGGVTAYAAAVNRGYTGTKEQFETLMASYATVAQQAVDAKEAAETAQGLAEDARDDAITAKNAAETANSGAVTAKNAAETAQAGAVSAKNAAETAQTAAESARDTAVSAKNTVQSTAQSFAETAAQAVTDVNTAGTNQKNLAQAAAEDSQAYAIGKRGESTVGSSDPTYHNNAKYYAEQANGKAGDAGDSALVAEGYANGTQNGTAVVSGSDYYQNNAAYHKEEAAASASDAEAWANGTRGGEDIESDDPAYGKSAKDYAEEAAASAASLTVDSALSSSSTNPVQSKVVNAAVNSLMEDLSKYGTTNDAPIRDGTSWTGRVYTVGKDGTYTVNGNNEYRSYYTIYNESASFPSGLSAGDSIYCGIETNAVIGIDVGQYIDGQQVWTTIPANSWVHVKIDESATGFVFRLRFEYIGTYADAVATPFLFTNLSKQELSDTLEETNDKIEENSTEIASIVTLLPKGYTPLEVTATRGLVNKYNEVADPSGYYYIKQAVAKDEKYRIGGWFYGGNFPAYLLLNNDSVVTAQNMDNTGAFNGVEVTIPASITHIVINGYTENPANIAKFGAVKVRQADARDSVVVGVGSEYSYNDINTAIVENAGSIIYVDYGTYETEIQNLATNKIIIGKDKDLCLLTGTNKDYDTPPIEIAGGIIKNFTVKMQNDENAEHKGYCLHSDNSATANNTLLVENCKFTCTGQHSVGMGVRGGEEVIFENCYFEQADGISGVMPIYIHNSAGTDPAVIRFRNCYFVGYDYCMKLQGWGSGMDVQFEFINCTCVSETYGTTDDCVWTDYVSGSTHDESRMHVFSGKFSLLATSHGNNVAVLNA